MWRSDKIRDTPNIVYTRDKLQFPPIYTTTTSDSTIDESRKEENKLIRMRRSETHTKKKAFSSEIHNNKAWRQWVEYRAALCKMYITSISILILNAKLTKLSSMRQKGRAGAMRGGGDDLSDVVDVLRAWIEPSEEIKRKRYFVESLLLNLDPLS